MLKRDSIHHQHGQSSAVFSGLSLMVGCLLVCSAFFFSPSAEAADWPQYRGADRDGVSSETGLLTTWPEEGPKKLWEAQLGSGFSGIAVVGKRVYTLYGDGEEEFALCLDAANGKELFKVRIGKDRDDRFGRGPRATPTVLGGKAYVVGSLGNLMAIDAISGEEKWSVDLVKEHGAKVPQWGVSVSPLVEGNLVLMDVGGKKGHSLMAFEAATGKVRWASGTDKPGYSTPLAIEVHGKRQVVFFTGTQVVSVDPANGEPMWSKPWATSYDINAATPIFMAPDKVFVSSGYDVGAAVFQIGADGRTVKEVWRSRVMKNQFNSSVLVGDYIYGFDDSTLKCIRADTGDELWKQRGFQTGSLLAADGSLFVLGEKGLLAVVEATPEGYKESTRFQLFQAKTWTMPTLANGVLYVRSEKELVALAVKPSA